MADAPLRAAGLIILTPNGDALFLRYASDHDHVGEWGIPAGGLEGNETPDVAAIRETREETGWTPQDKIKKIDENDGFTLYATVSEDQFIPELSDEHDDWCWAPLSNPPEPLLQELKELLDRLMAEDSNTVEDGYTQQAVAGALSAALYHLGNVWEPQLDREIEHLIETFQDRFDVSRAKARELLAPIISKARSMARDTEFKESDHPRGQPDGQDVSELNTGAVSSYASELKKTIHDNDSFDGIVRRLSGDRSIRIEEMRAIAKEFLGYSLGSGKGRAQVLKEITDRQMIEMRQRSRGAQIDKWNKGWDEAEFKGANAATRFGSEDKGFFTDPEGTVHPVTGGPPPDWDKVKAESVRNRLSAPAGFSTTEKNTAKEEMGFVRVGGEDRIDTSEFMDLADVKDLAQGVGGVLEQKDVNIRDLIAQQDYVTVGGINHGLNSDGRRVDVVKVGDKYHIIDGHNLTAAYILARRHSVPVNVYERDPESGLGADGARPYYDSAYGANAATRSELEHTIKFPPNKPKETRAINVAFANGRDSTLRNRRKRLARDAEFNESDHPRGQPENAGQFTAGSSGGRNKEKKDTIGPQPKLSESGSGKDTMRHASDVHTWLDSFPLPEPSKEESKALHNYSTDSYEGINHSMRAGRGDNIDDVARIKKYLSRCSLPTDMTVYRQVGGDFGQKLRDEAAVGKIFKEDAFSSTTARSDFGLWGNTNLTIFLPKGSKAAPIVKQALLKDQCEVLLQAGSRFKVVSVGGKYNNEIGLELLP